TTWDDNETLSGNPKLNPPTVASLKSFWTEPQMDLYVPVTYTTWALVANVAREPVQRGAGGGTGGGGAVRGSQLDPHAFHALNLGLHVIAAVAVLLILRDLFRSPAAALIGALLFALHPVQVEPVAWVSGTKDV